MKKQTMKEVISWLSGTLAFCLFGVYIFLVCCDHGAGITKNGSPLTSGSTYFLLVASIIISALISGILETTPEDKQNDYNKIFSNNRLHVT